MAADTPAMTMASVGTASYRSRFMVFEGIDGSGKTTIARLMHERITALGRPSVLTAEPTDSWTGYMVKEGNEKAASPFTETLLYMADRAEHTARIKQWLTDGKDVVCDRYVGSTLAYQGVTLRPLLGDSASEWLRTMNEPFTIRPDITILLLLDPEMAMERMNGRPGKEKFEKLEFLQGVDEQYRRLAKEDDSYVVIDASLPLEEVAETVWNIIARI
ncbi:MAG: dTMP kinase [Methanomassiliicoccaceae archaeon]|jgi:dTMP kinase|nr:dTMP kinase [Euryarchaeota archaeon]HOB37665.1 dTMP kinase [Methanomassiliicoccaceae archaeon]HOQ25239.1 dTMP kinase [Methanomassiliicoccaceae archaeon]HQA20580.1 dTMP kinase [Methanomassiliicoccaceae archaeon]HQD87106.1 dTMP kinase [Methanomassiliicoccaceae archaeon]